MATPTVDVIIPCHNRPAYVRLAVESVLAQTHPATSIVVVDDGSTDDIAGALAGLVGPVRIIQTAERSGAGAARNAGIDATSGELIAFLDDDDLWLPAKIERQVAFLRDHPSCGLVHTGILRIDAEGRALLTPTPLPSEQPLEGMCLTQLVRGSSIATASVVVRRDSLGGERFHTALRNAEDWDLWLRLAAQGPFGYISEPLVKYRVHPSNKSGNEERMNRARAVILERVLTREHDSAVRRIATGERRQALAYLAHAAFEAGRLAEARSGFLSLFPWLGLPEWRRLAAALLPTPVAMRLGRWWRGGTGLG